MEFVDLNLIEYIEKEIFPIYDNVDAGHNLNNHIIPVITESINLAKRLNLNLNLNIIYTIAAYHDIGLVNGREFHHLYSKKIVENDRNLKRWFTKDEIKIIAEAVEDHRASSQKEPRSIYGKIIADSDKNVDLNEIILRTHLCIKAKFPNEDLSDFDKEFEKAYEWIVEKDSEQGYLNFYLNREKASLLEKLHKEVTNKSLIKEKYKKIYTLNN